MNIFILDGEPDLAAQAMCDKHVIKGILECTQLLCGVHHVIDTPNLPAKFYKLTHKNHPVSVWCRTHEKNYVWAATHATSLCEEYTYRYDKTHASESMIEWCFNHVPAIRSYYYANREVYEPDDYLLGTMYVTWPAQAMPDEYKMDNVVEAYRKYYTEYKRNTITMKWTRREPPEWWNK